jgi:hypothetical protein
LDARRWTLNCPARDVPHSPQNLNCGGFSSPQLGHRLVNGLPHSPQNFFPAGLSKPHLAQCIQPLYSLYYCLGKRNVWLSRMRLPMVEEKRE